MGNVHRLILIPQYFLCGIPVWLASIAVKGPSLWPGLLAIFALLVLLCVMPICKGRESLIAFLLMTMMSIPVNIKAVSWLWMNELLGKPLVISGALWSIVIYGMLFSIEQIMIGVLIRTLWPRQYRTRTAKIKQDCYS